MTRFPPLNIVKISHIGRNAMNKQTHVVLIAGFAIVLQLQLETSGVCNLRSHGDTNKVNTKITKIFKKS